MRLRPVFLWIAIAALGLIARAAARPLPKDADDFFKWGEYDSLANRLETWMAIASAPTEPPDSANLAKANLYLGVAYYAAGKSSQSDSAFLRACRFEKGVKLDKFYVTGEMASRFDALVSTFSAKTEPPPPPKPGSSAPAASTSKGREMGWIWFGSGAVIAITAGTVYYFISQKSPPKAATTTVVDVP
jgi:hypothetical protein